MTKYKKPTWGSRLLYASEITFYNTATILMVINLLGLDSVSWWVITGFALAPALSILTVLGLFAFFKTHSD